MLLSKYYIPTLRDTPADAEVISHQLMLRAGMIKQVASGVYTWLPLGLKVYKKVEEIVRQEMNKVGALEVDMPSAQPSGLWQESGRWQDYGAELLRFKDRHNNEFCLGPTHEEVVTDLLRGNLKSYKQLPLTLYQIQKKFRDEVRPRFGVMRGREFLMKDAYSFHADIDSLKQTYQEMYDAYNAIFTRIGLNYRPVEADGGSIGGSASHEFHVLAKTGEDFIAFSDGSDFAANVELAECLTPDLVNFPNKQDLTEIHTPNCKTIDSVCNFLSVDIKGSIKTLVVEATDGGLIGICLRGNHRLNELKTEKIEGVLSPLKMADPEKIKETLGCNTGSIGPIGFNGRVIIDRACFVEQSIVCGANKDDYHFTGVNWSRDVGENLEVYDLRNIEQGDKSPDGNGNIIIKKGIEVGHIFQLGTKYSQAMKMNVLNNQGKAITPEMGCYGIGITRVVAAAIEQNNDANGIIWPISIAPFEVVIAPIGYGKSEQVTKVADDIYKFLTDKGIDVALDNRGLRPGVMFSELDLLGIPHRIVLGNKTLENSEVEYKFRENENAEMVSVDNINSFILNNLSNHLNKL